MLVLSPAPLFLHASSLTLTIASHNHSSAFYAIFFSPYHSKVLQIFYEYIVTRRKTRLISKAIPFFCIGHILSTFASWKSAPVKTSSHVSVISYTIDACLSFVLCVSNCFISAYVFQWGVFQGILSSLQSFLRKIIDRPKSLFHLS